MRFELSEEYNRQAQDLFFTRTRWPSCLRSVFLDILVSDQDALAFRCFIGRASRCGQDCGAEMGHHLDQHRSGWLREACDINQWDMALP